MADKENDGSGSTILCHAEAEGRLEARQGIVGTENKNIPAKFRQTVGAVVTSCCKSCNLVDYLFTVNQLFSPHYNLADLKTVILVQSCPTHDK